jgi:hypothetical protein
LKNLDMLPVSESLGNHWYQTKLTKQEREVKATVAKRAIHAKDENKEDKMMRSLETHFQNTEGNKPLQFQRTPSLVELTQHELLMRFKKIKRQMEDDSLKAIERA